MKSHEKRPITKENIVTHTNTHKPTHLHRSNFKKPGACWPMAGTHTHTHTHLV